MIETEKAIKEISTQVRLSSYPYKIIDLLSNNGPMTRDQICEAFGFKKIPSRKPQPNSSEETIKKIRKQYERRTTINDHLKKLIKIKIVEKYSHNNGERGRSIVLFKLKS